MAKKSEKNAPAKEITKTEQARGEGAAGQAHRGCDRDRRHGSDGGHATREQRGAEEGPKAKAPTTPSTVENPVKVVH